ncbi:MAG: mannosyltransferase, partial [Bacteroidota bacterium]
NPLVIVEGTGNLHFEGVMLFFFIWALYLLSVKKWAWAAVPYAMAIMVKLVPLMFLPLFLKYLGLRKSSIFYALIGLISLVFLLPFYAPEFADNYTKTVGLWFSNFEFNAGPYNLIKKIALIYEYKPWELVKDYGKITPYITILLVLLLSAFKVNKSLDSVIRAMLWILTAYYFMSTTVHPWYIIFLLPLGLFSQMRFPVVWSATVVLSYYAYSLADYTENMWLIAIEYLTVVSFFCYEFIKRRKQKPLFRKN